MCNKLDMEKAGNKFYAEIPQLLLFHNILLLVHEHLRVFVFIFQKNTYIFDKS